MVCKLCGSAAPLKESHIIPRFIGRWMKKTAPTPYFRYGGDMDKRTQDLGKMKLLCGDCENLFSAWETKFANEVFYPMSNGESMLWYKNWLLKFAASLTWRAIQVRSFEEGKRSEAFKQNMDDMELHLSRFLLGQAKNVGSYSQHIYYISGLAVPVRPGSPMLNRYLERGVEIDFLKTDDLSEMMVYVKVPMFMFFSIGASKYRKLYETSRIKKSGALHPKTHYLPGGILEYIISRANRMHELVNSMSPESRALADKALMKEIEKDPQKVANTKQMQALFADYKFYGKDAVVHKE